MHFMGEGSGGGWVIVGDCLRRGVPGMGVQD